MELEQCLKLLKAASSDTEMMAGLMLVAKLIKSNEIDSNGRRRVFETIGFTFLDRLLSTNEIPEGCNENPYHRIAVTILACFCTDEELALHPKFTSKVPTFNEFIQTKSPEGSHDDSLLAQDSLQCLRSLSGSPTGVQYLLKYQSLPALACAYITQNEVSEESVEVMLSVLGMLSLDKEPIRHCEVAEEIVSMLAQEFRLNQEQLKFKLCETLNLVLSVAENMLEGCGHDAAWLEDLRSGLADIFSSKLDAERRQLALTLSGGLSHLFGIEWAMERDKKFVLFWLHLVLVEVRLAVEGKELDEIVPKSSLLCSCFSVLENTIVFVSKYSDEDQSKENAFSEVLLKLHTVLTEALGFVLHLLMAASQSERFKEVRATSLRDVDEEYPIVIASVRVLGAWLAEDSLTLAAEVYELLPFLLELCASSAPQEDDGDMLKFLLPGLCHMTADDKARPIVLKAGLGNTLASYMGRLVPLCQDSSEKQGRLCLCCGVCMNVCVSSPDDVRRDKDGTFASIAALCINVLKTSFRDESDVLVMNAIVVLLMILRRKGELIEKATHSDVWCSVLDCLVANIKCSPHLLPTPCGQDHTPRNLAAKWEVVAHLWPLAIQELNGLISHHQAIKTAASKCRLSTELSDIVATLIKNDQKDEEAEMIQSLVQTLLQEMLTEKDST